MQTDGSLTNTERGKDNTMPKHLCQYQRMPGGHDMLVYAVVEQAVTDLRLLRAAGVIIGNKVIDPFPTQQLAYRQIGMDYGTPYSVLELIRFFEQGKAESLLQAVGARIDAQAMLQRLGIERKGKDASVK